ncbi:hypothetical protein EVG20_g11691 [Dentipellis fragilis]|uniref:Uncharacterized protein n=1 Tax=Dentipellis fragilis TaxID=205917 RepID=A0A4Y9XKG0_9AGAM|nr:hypothetical protein EVG20_g11691 [Dentipellis fragilis]
MRVLRYVVRPDAQQARCPFPKGSPTCLACLDAQRAHPVFLFGKACSLQYAPWSPRAQPAHHLFPKEKVARMLHTPTPSQPARFPIWEGAPLCTHLIVPSRPASPCHRPFREGVLLLVRLCVPSRPIPSRPASPPSLPTQEDMFALLRIPSPLAQPAHRCFLFEKTALCVASPVAQPARPEREGMSAFMRLPPS